MLAGGTEDKEHAMSQQLETSPAVNGIDIGKNSFHIVGQNQRGAIVLREKWSCGQVEDRLANLPPCRVGMEDNLRCPYLVAPRYVVHTALAKVWDVFLAHAFSTSATIDDTLILGCVWPLAAAT